MNIRKRSFAAWGTAAFCALLLACVALVGCGGGSDESSGLRPTMPDDIDETPTNVVIIYGRHANMEVDPTIAFNEDQIWSAIATNGLVSTVRLDGDPEIADSRQVELQSKNGSRRESEMKSTAREIAESLVSEELSAATEEVDIMAAFELAARELRSANQTDEDGNEYRNIVVVVDSGLATSGIVDFTQEDIFKADAQAYADSLANAEALPSLEGIDEVVWYNFGDVCDPQATEPTPGYKEKMRQIICACITMAGGAANESITFKDDASSKMSGSEPLAAADDAPAVTVIEFPDTLAGITIEYRESNSNIKFVGDQATFIDPDAARSDLSSVAEELINSSSLSVSITGYTAHYGDGSSLSQARANAVKAELVSMGVSESQITAVGAGWGPYPKSSEEGYDNKDDAYKALTNDEIDAMNRCIILEFQ